VEAAADTHGVVAQTTTGAITTSLVTITLEHISTRRALNYIKKQEWVVSDQIKTEFWGERGFRKRKKLLT
jgi:hypothetical protein